jgi:hypothetical protein
VNTVLERRLKDMRNEEMLVEVNVAIPETTII